MSVGIIIGQDCHYCAKFRSPAELIHWPGGVRICVACEQRHQEALEALSKGVFTGECSECGLSADELRAQNRCGPNGAMAVHYENGRYRAMCLVCDRAYVPRRRDIYGKTEFGWDAKLK